MNIFLCLFLFFCFESCFFFFFSYWTIWAYSWQPLRYQRWPLPPGIHAVSVPSHIVSGLVWVTRVYGRSNGMSFSRFTGKRYLASLLVALSLLLLSHLLWGKPAAMSGNYWWRRPHGEGLKILAKSHIRNPQSGSSSPRWAFRWVCNPSWQHNRNLMRDSESELPSLAFPRFLTLKLRGNKYLLF